MAYNIAADKNPTCVNILKLQRYNFKFFSLEEVIFFEYLVVKAKAFGFKQFFHSTETISRETGIKRSKLDSIIKRFYSLGLISVEVKGFPKVKYFKLDFEKVFTLLSKIYKSADNGKLSADMLKLLSDFYNPLVETYQKKNNIIRIDNKNIKEEKRVYDSEWVAFANKIDGFLFELKTEFDINDTRLKYDEQQLIYLYNNYAQDQISEYLRRFFQENLHTSKFSDFLKTDKLTTTKNNYIETSIYEDKKFAKNLLESLNDIFNQRRESNSYKKKFTKTALAINNASIEKIIKVSKLKGEQEIKNSFIAYTDAIIKNEIQPNKILPYFFAERYGEYAVIDQYLDYFNVNYAIQSK